MTIEETFQDLGVEFLHSGNKHCRPGWVGFLVAAHSVLPHTK